MTTEITEKWARTAPAGAELDRVCAEWMGEIEARESNVSVMFVCGMDAYHRKDLDEYRMEFWPKYSTDWSAAGPLLEAISPPWSLSPNEDCGFIMLPYRMTVLNLVGGNRYTWPRAECPCLAIARACAVLAARGITREDLEDV